MSHEDILVISEDELHSPKDYSLSETSECEFSIQFLNFAQYNYKEIYL